MAGLGDEPTVDDINRIDFAHMPKAEFADHLRLRDAVKRVDISRRLAERKGKSGLALEVDIAQNDGC